MFYPYEGYRSVTPLDAARFVSDAWPAPATYRRSFCEHCDQRVGRSSLTSTPRSDFMAQSLALPIDVCRELGISPLRINIWLSFSQADLGPTSAQELFFSCFVKSLIFFFGDLCSQRAVQNYFGGYLWNSIFFWQHRVSIVTGLISVRVLYL